MNNVLFGPSPTCQRYLNGLKGLEIGGSAHNHSGLEPRPINVDYTDEMTHFKMEEIQLVGWRLPVDVVADMGQLPFDDNAFHYIFSSHVLEHAFDPFSVLKHWILIASKYIAIILPHPERTFDKGKKLTTIEDIKRRIKYSLSLTDLDAKFYEMPRFYRSKFADSKLKEWAVKRDDFIEPEHDHWNIWTPATFEDFIIEFFPTEVTIKTILDPDDKAGNGFLVILKVN